jgi:site-specific recombinase XerD
VHIQANNYSHETLYNYERDLDTFAHFLKNEMRELPFEKITKKLLSTIRPTSTPPLARPQADKLGHEALETTTRYVHASDRYAETTHRDFHPLKK